MVPYQTVNEYLALEGSATEINIRLSNYRSADAERERIEELVDPYEVMTWEELGADYFAFAAADEGGADIMLFFVFIITAVGIFEHYADECSGAHARAWYGESSGDEKQQHQIAFRAGSRGDRSGRDIGRYCGGVVCQYLPRAIWN